MYTGNCLCIVQSSIVVDVTLDSRIFVLYTYWELYRCWWPKPVHMNWTDSVVPVRWIIIKHNEIKEAMICYRNTKEKKIEIFQV